MNLLQQFKSRRLELGLQQKDMPLRIGMNRQQYQRLEAGGNPRLNTVELIAKGLDAELVLLPRESLRQVKELLQKNKKGQSHIQKPAKVSDDPWKDMLD